MGYEFLSHTSDARMRVRNKDREELFREAAFGMLAHMEPRVSKNNDAEADRVVKVSAMDETALLIDFLSEVLRLSLQNNELYERMGFMKITDTELDVELYGRLVEQYDREIKAVTHRGADVRRNASGEWETEVVFDI